MNAIKKANNLVVMSLELNASSKPNVDKKSHRSWSELPKKFKISACNIQQAQKNRAYKKLIVFFSNYFLNDVVCARILTFFNVEIAWKQNLLLY